jgi:hypothetical protein
MTQRYFLFHNGEQQQMCSLIFTPPTSGKGSMNTADAIIDRAVEIERLVALDPVDYEIARAEAAKRLKMRTSVLDSIVVKKRHQLGLDTNDADDGQGRAVKFADVLPWYEPVDGDYLASSLAAAIKCYAVLSEIAADAIALWILHTWTLPAFMISARLAITSPIKGCGKTTVLRLLEKLVCRPKGSGSISPAALFRVIEAFQPTLLLDENEKYLENGGDLHALLNEGHRRGGTVLRVLGENFELREFAVFSAVALARNVKLPDDLEQRSIVIVMQRRLPYETLTELRDDRCDSLCDLARKCARWGEDHLAEITDSDPDMGGLVNREADNWRPLFVIADAIGSDWPQRIRDAAAALTHDSEGVGPTLLADIKTVFGGRQTDRLTSAQLCAALEEIEGHPWAEWRASKGAAGKPITPNQLARLLKPFGVHPDSVRVSEQKTLKGYYCRQFEKLWERYLTPEGVSEPERRNKPPAAGTTATFRTGTADHDVPVQKCEKPLSDGPCSGVPVQNGGMAADRHRGLSERTVRQIADEAEVWVERRRHEGDISPRDLTAQVRLMVARAGVLPEAVAIEAERVIECLFER